MCMFLFCYFLWSLGRSKLKREDISNRWVMTLGIVMDYDRQQIQIQSAGSEYMAV